MTDIVDHAAALADEHLARSLAAISASIPAGVAGECDECGEMMPRLVGGRCGFCRDGRRPPADHYPDPATIAAPVDQPEEACVTTTTIESRKITVEGAALAAVERLANASDIPFKQAAAELIASASHSDAMVLANVPNGQLADELARRMGDGVSSEEHDAVVAERDALVVQRDAALVRAEASEGALAVLKTQLGQLLG